MNYQPYLDTALSTAKAIAPLFLQGFQEKNHIQWKGERDPVTIYDQQIEQKTKELITNAYQNHMVLGEEDGLNQSNNSDFIWIVDPIDGTNNYIRQIPFVSYSLALSYKNEIVVGVIFDPIHNEYFWATKNGGSFLNGEKISISSITEINKSYIALGAYKKLYINEYHQLISKFQSVRNPGSAALALAYTAIGRIEASVYFRLSPWDMAAGILLVTEAGGNVSNINSSTFTLEKKSIIAANPSSYQEISTTLQSITEFN